MESRVFKAYRVIRACKVSRGIRDGKAEEVRDCRAIKA